METEKVDIERWLKVRKSDIILTKFEIFIWAHADSFMYIRVLSFDDSSSQHFFGNDIWKHFPIRIYSLLPHMLSKFTYVVRLYQHQT